MCYLFQGFTHLLHYLFFIIFSMVRSICSFAGVRALAHVQGHVAVLDPARGQGLALVEAAAAAAVDPTAGLDPVLTARAHVERAQPRKRVVAVIAARARANHVRNPSKKVGESTLISPFISRFQ
jgi:hypothetical protein